MGSRQSAPKGVLRHRAQAEPRRRLTRSLPPFLLPLFTDPAQLPILCVLGSPHPALPRSSTYERPGLSSRSLKRSRQAPLFSSSRSEAPSDLPFSSSPACAQP